MLKPTIQPEVSKRHLKTLDDAYRIAASGLACRRPQVQPPSRLTTKQASNSRSRCRRWTSRKAQAATNNFTGQEPLPVLGREGGNHWLLGSSRLTRPMQLPGSRRSRRLRLRTARVAARVRPPRSRGPAAIRPAARRSNRAQLVPALASRHRAPLSSRTRWQPVRSH